MFQQSTVYETVLPVQADGNGVFVGGGPADHATGAAAKRATATSAPTAMNLPLDPVCLSPLLILFDTGPFRHRPPGAT